MPRVVLTPLEFSTLIRLSRPDSIEWFTSGGCWEFFVLCHRYFVSAIPIYDPIVGHVAVKIDDLVFDITGKIRNTDAYSTQSIWFWKTYKPHRWVKSLSRLKSV